MARRALEEEREPSVRERYWVLLLIYGAVPVYVWTVLCIVFFDPLSIWCPLTMTAGIMAWWHYFYVPKYNAYILGRLTYRRKEQRKDNPA